MFSLASMPCWVSGYLPDNLFNWEMHSSKRATARA